MVVAVAVGGGFMVALSVAAVVAMAVVVVTMAVVVVAMYVVLYS